MIGDMLSLFGQKIKSFCLRLRGIRMQIQPEVIFDMVKLDQVFLNNRKCLGNNSNAILIEHNLHNILGKKELPSPSGKSFHEDRIFNIDFELTIQKIISL